MPIQPLAPTRLLNARLCVSPWPGRSGAKVPAAISSAMKARTSSRSFWHPGGKRIWSKWRLVLMVSPRRQHGPELVDAVRRDHPAERRGPMAFAAKIVAPGQDAQREAMQNVLVGETDRAVHL